MKILIPTADYPPIEGGISTVARQVARELAALGHGVTVVAPWFPGVAEHDRAEPVRVVRFPGYGLGWFRFIPMLLWTLPHLRRADLILGINIAYGGVIARWAKTALGTPYVTFGYAYEFLKFPATSTPGRILRAAYRQADLIVAISRFTRNSLVQFGVDPSQIAVVLPGAIKAESTDNECAEHFKKQFAVNGHSLLLSVGRFIPRKGHQQLVRAMPDVLERHPETVLVCAGQGPTHKETMALAAELGVADAVRFPGKLDDRDLAAAYAACDVFALPAGTAANGQVEGFGLVYAEAGAHGKPVVAGRSGGTEDAVLDGETGLLVDPDDTAALADALNRLLGDREFAGKLGSQGRDRVESELNWAEFTRRMLAELEARR